MMAIHLHWLKALLMHLTRWTQYQVPEQGQGQQVMGLVVLELRLLLGPAASELLVPDMVLPAYAACI